MNNKSSAIQKIVEEGTWYHSIAIENLKSKGTFDYSNLVNKLNFPRMDNLNVLDVGCSDGFFSIYFLKNLGAKEVTGVDFNDYDGKVAFEVLKSKKKDYEMKYQSQNDFSILKKYYEELNLSNSNKFLFLKEILELNMVYESGSIYDLSRFESHDVTFCGSLLEHLRDPVTAIEQLYSKTNKFCIIDVSNSLTGIYTLLNIPLIKYTGAGGNFYKYSKSSVSLIMKAVGFKNVKILSNYKIKIEKYGYKIPHTVLIGYK